MRSRRSSSKLVKSSSPLPPAMGGDGFAADRVLVFEMEALLEGRGWPLRVTASVAVMRSGVLLLDPGIGCCGDAVRGWCGKREVHGDLDVADDPEASRDADAPLPRRWAACPPIRAGP